MGGTGVVDRFLDIFSRYIDSGFGLLSGEVAFIATTLIVIDVTLAALFWSWGEADDVLARLVKKTLFVGIFAYIIGNWNNLARIVFESFAGLGLKASGTGFTAAELLQPGRVAQVGMDAAQPMLTAISDLMGFVSFFENFLQIVILLLAWAIVIIAFFILAIQLFVTLIEFKLTTLCGFVLIPFGLFGKTAFMAERVLGNVVSSGIKVLVLAVIVGIGSTIFTEFTSAIGPEPTIEDALSVVLASLSLLGLGIFGPGIANGIVSGGPQLGAGAAAGTALLAGGAAAGAVAGARMAGGAVASAASNVAHGTSRAAGGASMAYALGSAGKSGASAVGSGMAAVGDAAVGAATSPLRKAGDSMRQSFREGSRAAITNTGGTITPGPSTPPASPSDPDQGQPAWAKLRGDPPRVMRLSRKAIGIASACGFALVGGALIYALQPAGRKGAEELYNTDGVAVADNLAGAPKDYGQVPKLGPPLPGDLGKPILDAQRRGDVAQLPPIGAQPPAAPINPAAIAADAARQRAEQEREAARGSRLFFGGGSQASGGAVGLAGLPPAAVGEATAPTAAPQTEAGRKQAFLERASDRRTVSSERLTGLASPSILQAGSVIPAALITGIRSDLPGLVTAQVTQNVYDSPTGRILLIPQGSRLIGDYDADVAFGQSRILLAWNRLILPDGRSIVLERQPASDPRGYAGLQDGTDYHWGGVLKAALVSTLLGAGLEFGSGDDDNLARAFRRGTQDSVGRAGEQIVSRELNVRPTLTIRPGFPVRVLVTRDLVLGGGQ